MKSSAIVRFDDSPTDLPASTALTTVLSVQSVPAGSWVALAEATVVNPNGSPAIIKRNIVAPGDEAQPPSQSDLVNPGSLVTTFTLVGGAQPRRRSTPFCLAVRTRRSVA